MRYTDKITIENPSRKLEERLREIGVRKYLRLKKLAKDDMSSAKSDRTFQYKNIEVGFSQICLSDTSIVIILVE